MLFKHLFKSTVIFSILFLFSIVPQLWLHIILDIYKIQINSSLAILTILIIIFNLYLTIKLIFFITKIPLDFLSINLNKALSYIFLGFMTTLLFRLWIIFFSTFETTNQKGIDTLQSQMPFFLFFLFAVISAPILEELVCRLFIMGYAFKDYPILGVFISIIIFILPHRPSNLDEFIVYLGPALSCSGIFYFSKRIEYSILFHMFINILSIL